MRITGREDASIAEASSGIRKGNHSAPPVIVAEEVVAASNSDNVKTGCRQYTHEAYPVTLGVRLMPRSSPAGYR